MKLNKKIPAFTLMEVTISMLIAGIAIAITFTAYQIVSGSYRGFTKKQEKIATLILADKLLKKDFLNAATVLKSGDGLLLDSDQGLITYTFTNDYILRDQYALRTDTFKLGLSNLNFLFETHPVEEGGLVDHFSLQARLDGDAMPFQYQKLYSAQNLFE